MTHPDLPPSLREYFETIEDYHAGRLTVEAAGKRLFDAMSKHGEPLNIEMSPSIRALMSEVQRLATGKPLPPFVPDPDRHRDGGRGMIASLGSQVWQSIARHPRSAEPLSIRCHFAAATEAAALRLVRWLESNGGHSVHCASPTEADADDWVLYSDTPPTVWTQPRVRQWATLIRKAPLSPEASLTGWGV